MSAYVISEVRILDEADADTYRTLAAASIERYGGRYLARGEIPAVVEGTWSAGERMVIAEFPNMARLREWYASPEYADALKIRATALDRRLLFVNGVEVAAEQTGSSVDTGRLR